MEFQQVAGIVTRERDTDALPQAFLTCFGMTTIMIMRLTSARVTKLRTSES